MRSIAPGSSSATAVSNAATPTAATRQQAEMRRAPRWARAGSSAARRPEYLAADRLIMRAYPPLRSAEV